MPQKSLLKGQHDVDDIISGIPSSHLSSRETEQPKADSLHQGVLYSEEEPKVHTEPLHRQGYIIWLVSIYAAIFITGWYILVLTSRHPLGRKSYNCFDNPQDDCKYESTMSLNRQNIRTTWYISKAQTLLSTVALLTIPLTSAVCAAAVVPWLQQSGRDMSLRQIITLSDKGWTSPYIYYKLLTPSGWKRYGSSFIALALLLHALGAALSPAISQMSAIVTIKVPTNFPTSSFVGRLLRLEDLIQAGDSVDDGTTVLRLRDALRTADLNQIQAQLWVPHNMSCTSASEWDPSEDGLPMATQCDSGGFLTYNALANETEVWLSELSNGFSTGIKSKQYLPRINSSVSVEVLDEMPIVCNSDSAALLISYAGTSSSINASTVVFKWSVQACVPDYPSTTVFNYTDNAQTLIETAYIDLQGSHWDYGLIRNITRITISTTVGYFELPNHNNDNMPGPLLNEFVLAKDSWYRDRRHRRGAAVPEMPNYRLSLDTNSSTSVPVIEDLELLKKKGPLLNIIYALFGNGSMPSIYVTENATYNTGFSGDLNNPCLELVPLQTITHAYSPTTSTLHSDCVDWYSMAMGNQMFTFISQFTVPPVALERVFRTAAYMSHAIWFSTIDGKHKIEYDPGQDMQKPGLDDRSIVALTIAIAVFLLSLLLLAFYASFSKTWTYSLDAYALLRMGADLGRDALPFLNVKDTHVISELDDLPGWVGDITADSSAKERELGMGFNSLGPRNVAAVRGTEKYLSYPRMPRGKRGFPMVCHWCDFLFGLGGRRPTRAGQRLWKAREQYREWCAGFSWHALWRRIWHRRRDDRPALMYQSLGVPELRQDV